MKFEIIYSEESVEDLFKIYDYIANVEKEQLNALKLIDAIRSGVNALDVFPLRHSKVSVSPWKEIGVRYLVIKKYIIFYFVNETKNTVNIIRIFSSRQDISNIIKKIDVNMK